VAARLVALIVIPTTVAALLAGLRVSSAMSTAAVYQRVERLSELAGRTNALVHELAAERELTAAYAATNPDPQRRAAVESGSLRRQQAAVDRAAASVRTAASSIDSSYSQVVRDQVRDVQTWLDGLPALRQLATKTWLSPLAGIGKYSQFIQALLELNDDVSSGVTVPDLSATARAEASLARAKEAAAKEAAILHEVLIVGRFEPTELEALRSARAERDSDLVAFQTSATPAQRQAYDDTVSGPEVDRGEELRQQVVSRMSDSGSLSLRPVLQASDGERWSTYAAAVRGKARAAEKNLLDSIITRSAGLKADARRAALIDASLLFVVIFLVLTVTVFVARSLVQPLRSLRAGALEVASNQLPGLVGRLRDPDALASGIDVAPIDIESTDEIGEVARAFDEVHREAVRLASNEAMLRGNVNAMFVNLSRRSQSLIERQLRLIDDLEQGEQDDKRLDSLFRLDHLATRMRRNCENLLVLGGQEQVRRWNQPVPLVDIVRAALSEVEQYDRVGVRIEGEISVVGPVVNDLIHLAAELIENATVFSPEHTKVAISGHALSGGGAMLQITDNGVGMSPQELEEANWRLANPPVVDVSVARRMGLFVVGRLAGRHGIQIELRAALSGGITAFVLLPARAVASDAGPALMPRRFDTGRAESPAGVGAAQQSAAGSALGGLARDRGALTHSAELPPGLGTETPSFGTETPSFGTESPGFGTESPGLGSEKPGFGTETPGFGTDTPGLGIEAPGFGTERPEPPGWSRQDRPGQSTTPHTGPQPLMGGHSGPQPVVGQTGPMPAVEPHSGPQPTVERHSGSQPVARQSGSFPAVDRNTGSRPALGRRTGSQPAVEQTGPQPRLGRTGPQPAVPAWPEATPAAPAADPGEFLGSGGVSWEDGPSAAEPTTPPPAPSPPPPPPPAPSTAAPPAAGRSERSPIFEAMESEWFQRRTTSPSLRGGTPARSWTSPADEGWQAAEVVQNPAATGQTAVGLPKRVPGTNRVPGAVPTSSTPTPGAPGAPPGPAVRQPPPQSAETIRNRFSSLQRGVHRGRAQIRSDDDDPSTTGRTGETS
jgi:signal transduction histidine kinase